MKMKLCDECLNSLKKNLKKDKEVIISGVGTLKISKRKSKRYMNIATRNIEKAKATKLILFKPAKKLREDIL